MAIEFFTGFEGCASAADVRCFFDGWEYDMFYTIGLSETGGHNDSKCLQLGSSYRVTVYKNFEAAATKAIGFHLKGLGTTSFDDLPKRIWMTIYNTAGGAIRLVNTVDGLRAYVGTTLVASSTEKINTSICHVEVKIVSDTTVGSIQVKVNGLYLINESSLNTGSTPLHRFHFGAMGYTSYYDNIYIADDFQGELYSYLLQPTADASVQFTPLSGTDNFAMIQSNDGDTSYVESDTIGQKDLYSYEDLPVGLIPIAVSVCGIMRKEGTGTRILQLLSNQDAVEYLESLQYAVPITYPSTYGARIMRDIKEVCPDGTVLTRDKLNAVQWGFKVTG